jgi:energy-coupling factor transporter ATP-binding protein EcfA2
MNTPKLNRNLEKYINHSQPFGPWKMEDISDGHFKPDEEMALFEALHPHVRKLDENIVAFIVGRRGCGKSTLLQSFKYKISPPTPRLHAFATRLEKAPQVLQGKSFALNFGRRTLEGLIVAVSGTHGKEGNVGIETTSDIWETVFYAAACQFMRKDLQEKEPADEDAPLEGYPRAIQYPVISQFLEKLNISDSDNINTAMQTAAENFSDKTEFQEKLFAARDEIESFLEQRKARIYLLFDSLDKYQADRNHVQNALGGLCRRIGTMAQVDSRVRVISNVPAELFNEFKRFSGAGDIYFERCMRLRWPQAHEIMTIAANRYRHYLRIYFSNDPLSRKDLNSPVDAKAFLDAILPASLEESDIPETLTQVGVTDPISPHDKSGGFFFENETPLNYIMRHTQQNPRHLIFILNSIWRETNDHLDSFRSKSSAIPKGVPKAYFHGLVINGVKLAVETITDFIFAMYEFSRPHAEEFCYQILHKLPPVFLFSELEAAYREARFPMQTGYLLDDCFQSLLEIGAVGEVIQQRDNWVHGKFEYSITGRLKPSAGSKLCMHPMFSLMAWPAIHDKESQLRKDLIVIPHNLDI